MTKRKLNNELKENVSNKVQKTNDNDENSMIIARLKKFLESKWLDPLNGVSLFKIFSFKLVTSTF